MHTRAADEALATLAGRQHGVGSVAQMRRLGLDHRAGSRRQAAGRLHRLHRGVYAVGHTALTERAWLLAAVMACGPGAAISHRTAGALWGIVRAGGLIDVTCTRA